LLTAFVDTRKLGEVLPSGMRVNTSLGNYRIPDVIYLSAEHENEWGGEQFFKGVDLAKEVVSDDDQSQHRDYKLKVATYAEAGIPEYWIVDLKEKRITVLTLSEGATEYAEHGVFHPGTSATTKLLEGFSVDVQSVFDAAKG
jgi:Uma2 family endonuclease